VEQRTRKGEIVFIEEYLNLWARTDCDRCDSTEVQKLEVLDAAARNRSRKALQTLADSLDHEKKSLRFTFSGKGVRPVRIGYMVESPVWKTSYRMVVEEGRCFCRVGAYRKYDGRGLERVRISLVSGRAALFVQNMYDPIDLPRPVVEMEPTEPCASGVGHKRGSNAPGGGRRA
jgi:hypothetical protein